MTTLLEQNDWLKEIEFLIFDPTQKHQDIISQSLSNLNIRKERLSFAFNKNMALYKIKEKSPHFVISYISKKEQSVFQILDAQKAAQKNQAKTYFLAFAGSKEINTFAQALEEEIDEYLLEPLTLEKFERKIAKTIEKKNKLSDYKKTIKNIQMAITQENTELAYKLVDKALTQSQRPCMAYYYKAKTELLDHQVDKAIKSLITGLKFNKSHYRCLLLLHELLCQKNEFNKAYRVQKKIAESFPLSPQRISDLFRLGIKTGHIDEVLSYCRKILSEGEASLEVVQFATSGIIVAARSILKSNELQGVELLKEVTSFSRGDSKILRNIFKCYIQHGLYNNAEKVLNFFKQEERESLDFKVCQYLHLIHSSLPVKNLVAECKTYLSRVLIDEDCVFAIRARIEKEADMNLLESFDNVLKELYYET